MPQVQTVKIKNTMEANTASIKYENLSLLIYLKIDWNELVKAFIIGKSVVVSLFTNTGVIKKDISMPGRIQNKYPKDKATVYKIPPKVYLRSFLEINW